MVMLRPRDTSICQECGRQYKKTQTAQRYCSTECRDKCRDRKMRIAKEMRKERQLAEENNRKAQEEFEKKQPNLAYSLKHGISYAEAQKAGTLKMLKDKLGEIV